MTLHELLPDGSFRHSAFTRQSWESALRDPGVVRRWGHPDDDCFDPVERILAEYRESSPPEPEVMVKATVPREPIAWPPESELQPWMLREMSGLCTEDCKEILLAPRKLYSLDVVRVNKKGQMFLF